MKRVLIIEDDVEIAELLATRFQASAFETKQVVDAFFGMKEPRNFKPDIIILDLMLPAGGGLYVLKQLRLSTHTREIPIIVYTGKGEEEYKEEIEQYSIEAHFQKPYDPQKLVDKALEILKNKNTHS